MANYCVKGNDLRARETRYCTEVLVDRTWHRGSSEDELGHDERLKYVASSTETRRKFDECFRRHRAELERGGRDVDKRKVPAQGVLTLLDAGKGRESGRLRIPAARLERA
ncbi:DUF488 family protein [Corynebacterium doosanense]|uniref:MarR family transcriptional regulator n=1 Tax=Corynebacterium doosanense CAU 212 = DSM 45436 TaxID=558173 RepID=A0A097IED2_9CORY|nr:DUF488 family protein [Corynebacterium doosanense]AIT60493.1 MarR family transcriptional regulator [Corynebacterium doosanense CAU 212 = DSM 45436]